MGAGEVQEGSGRLRAAGVPVFPYPDLAARMFNFTWRWADNLRSCTRRLALPTIAGRRCGGRGRARLVAGARGEGRTLLTESESKGLLAAYGIPVVETRVAATSRPR
jgi:acetyltransferase